MVVDQPHNEQIQRKKSYNVQKMIIFKFISLCPRIFFRFKRIF